MAESREVVGYITMACGEARQILTVSASPGLRIEGLLPPHTPRVWVGSHGHFHVGGDE